MPRSRRHKPSSASADELLSSPSRSQCNRTYIQLRGELLIAATAPVESAQTVVTLREEQPPDTRVSMQPSRRPTRRRGAPRRNRAALALRTDTHRLRYGHEALTCLSAFLTRLGVSRCGAPDGSRCDRDRDGRPGAQGPPRRGPRRRRDHCYRALWLPQPDQHRARVPERVRPPRRPISSPSSRRRRSRMRGWLS
jgi:hypothetical protein